MCDSNINNKPRLNSTPAFGTFVFSSDGGGLDCLLKIPPITTSEMEGATHKRTMSFTVDNLVQNNKPKIKKVAASRVASADSYFANNNTNNIYNNAPPVFPSLNLEEKKGKKSHKKRKTKQALEQILQEDSQITVKDLVNQLQSQQKVTRKDPFFSSLASQSQSNNITHNQTSPAQATTNNTTSFDSFLAFSFGAENNMQDLNLPHSNQEFPTISFNSVPFYMDQHHKTMPEIAPEKKPFNPYSKPPIYPPSSLFQEVEDLSKEYLKDLIQVSQLRAPEVYEFPTFGSNY